MQIATPPRCFALVPCAGIGARAGTAAPKQYQPIAGQAVVAHTLAALAAVPRLAATLVVLAPGDDGFERAAPAFRGERAWVARCGGATRADSVANGLAELVARGAQPHDWVLVHDAARCLLRAAWVDALIDACWDDEVGGLLALPVADTLKQEEGGRAAATVDRRAGRREAATVDRRAGPREAATVDRRAGRRVAATVDRRGKWAAQTPQMFRLGLLRPALLHAGDSVTDESGAVELLGHAPRLVPGALENLKVTWPDDFALAERLLRSAA